MHWTRFLLIHRNVRLSSHLVLNLKAVDILSRLFSLLIHDSVFCLVNYGRLLITRGILERRFCEDEAFAAKHRRLFAAFPIFGDSPSARCERANLLNDDLAQVFLRLFFLFDDASGGK